MVSRILLICALCLLVVVPAQAEPTVYFRGKQLTFRHYVYGEVTAATGRSGTINLGYAHGLQQEQEIGILRRNGGVLYPIGVLRLTSVRPGDAYGEFEGEFPIRRDDLLIVSARELNLWQGRSRSNQLVIDSILNRDANGYDTGDISPSLLNELGRDDGLITHRPALLHVNADFNATPRPKFTRQEVRGAFRPASGDEDGPANSLSAKDRQLSTDKPTLDLEIALARFATSSVSGNVVIDGESLRELSEDVPGVINLDLARTNLNLANSRVHRLLRPQ